MTSISAEAIETFFAYLEFGIIAERLIPDLGNAQTYPQERIDFATKALARVCYDPDTFISIVPFLIEDQINDSQLDECSRGVLDEIKGLQNMDVAKILARLDADGATYRTSMKTKAFATN